MEPNPNIQSKKTTEPAETSRWKTQETVSTKKSNDDSNGNSVTKIVHNKYVYIPGKNPGWVAFVKMNGNLFQGTGNCRKSAKTDADNKALNHLDKINPLRDENKTTPSSKDAQHIEIDKVTSNTVVKSSEKLVNIPSTEKTTPLKQTGEDTSNVHKNIEPLIKSENEENCNAQRNIVAKHPVSEMNELKSQFEEVKVPGEKTVFKARVEVEGQYYYGSGNSKKVAKHAAALEAIKNMSLNNAKNTEIKESHPQISKQLSNEESGFKNLRELERHITKSEASLEYGKSEACNTLDEQMDLKVPDDVNGEIIWDKFESLNLAEQLENVVIFSQILALRCKRNLEYTSEKQIILPNPPEILYFNL